MASLGKDVGRHEEVRKGLAALKSRDSFKLELCLLHQTVLNTNCDHVGGRHWVKILCVPRRENGVERRALCWVVGGPGAWVQRGGGDGGKLWVSPEWSSFTRDDMVLVMESAATSRSLRRFLLVPEGPEQMVMRGSEHGDEC